MAERAIETHERSSGTFTLIHLTEDQIYASSEGAEGSNLLLKVVTVALGLY